jgi:hypothetical protein
VLPHSVRGFISNEHVYDDCHSVWAWKQVNSTNRTAPVTEFQSVHNITQNLSSALIWQFPREQLKAAIAVGLYAAECAKVLVDAQTATLRPESELELKFIKWIERNPGTPTSGRHTDGKVQIWNQASGATLAGLLDIHFSP